MSARIFFTAAALMVLLTVIAPAVPCADFDANTSPFHQERTITKTGFDVYRFSIGSNQAVDWKTRVTDGLNIDVFVMDQDQVEKALAGQTFEHYRFESKENTRDASGTKTANGDFAILVTTSGNANGNCTYTMDITKRSLSTSEFAWTYFCGALLAIAIVLTIAGWVLRARRIARARSAGRSLQPETGIPGGGKPGTGSEAGLCPTCGRPLVFYKEQNKYWCPRESRWI